MIWKILDGETAVAHLYVYRLVQCGAVAQNPGMSLGRALRFAKKKLLEKIHLYLENVICFTFFYFCKMGVSIVHPWLQLTRTIKTVALIFR